MSTIKYRASSALAMLGVEGPRRRGERSKRQSRHEVDYGDYVGADQDAERVEEQLTGQFEEEPNDGDRLLAALENFLRDTETIRKIGATALDAVSATHEQLAEDTDEYRAWRQRVCSEILRGAVQLAGFDSTRLRLVRGPVKARTMRSSLMNLQMSTSRK